MLLHNQWPIRPVGSQTAVGEFPVNVAVDPLGRFAAVLNDGYMAHGVRLVNLHSGAEIQRRPIHDTFAGIAFSPDGSTLACSGGSDGTVHLFAVDARGLGAEHAVVLADLKQGGVLGGVTFSPDGRSLLAAIVYGGGLICYDLDKGAVRWTTKLDPTLAGPGRLASTDEFAPNDVLDVPILFDQVDPFHVVWDRKRNRAYVSEWGRSNVGVVDLDTGALVSTWTCGLHPNELVLGRDGRLFVANGGQNTVTVIDTASGQAIETLSTAIRSKDLPGATPDSLALTADGKTLFVANGYTNNVAVFDVSEPTKSAPLGFIPTGWFPSAVRVAADGRSLLILSARGLNALPDAIGWKPRLHDIRTIYAGSLAILPLRKKDGFARDLAGWTKTAESLFPAPVVPPARPSAIPLTLGGASPLKYVLYIIKENRTYDQVLGDMKEGNGDASLCLFPERVTPNAHAISRQFVLLDNVYANAEVSASGHEWSMAGYSSEFVEKTWPVYYGHKDGNEPYPAEGHFKAAVPALGYLWDQAKAAGVTYRSYGEFTVSSPDTSKAVTANLPALQGHFDPHYIGWNLKYRDVARADRFIAELHRYEREGGMPQLQILRLPQDHTNAGMGGGLTPAAMVADNDLGLGRIVEAVSHSKFWPQTAIFVIEDDAQNGPDHVDAHRTVALVASPYGRAGLVDSTPYTTCSLLRTIELILGIPPLSQFDAAAAPMLTSFSGPLNLAPYVALPETVDMNAINPKATKVAKLSAHFDFSKEDLVDDRLFTRAIWKAVRGEYAEPPAPVHAAFVRPMPVSDDDDDD